MGLLLLARGNVKRRWKEDKKRKEKSKEKRREEEIGHKENRKRGKMKKEEETGVDGEGVIVAGSGKSRETMERGQETRKENRK